MSHSLAAGAVQRCAAQMFLAAATVCIAVVSVIPYDDPFAPEGGRQSPGMCACARETQHARM